MGEFSSSRSMRGTVVTFNVEWNKAMNGPSFFFVTVLLLVQR
jgi:hypothetical protein